MLEHFKIAQKQKRSHCTVCSNYSMITRKAAICTVSVSLDLIPSGFRWSRRGSGTAPHLATICLSFSFK